MNSVAEPENRASVSFSEELGDINVYEVVADYTPEGSNPNEEPVTKEKNEDSE